MLSDLYRGSSIFLILWWLWVSCDKSPTGVSLRWSAHSREDRPQRCSDFGSLLGNFKPWPSEPAPVGSTCEWVTTRLTFLSVTLLDRIVFNDLLLCSCPYQDDRYLTTLIPVDGSSGLLFPTHYKRFVLKMFTFVEPATLAPLMEKVLLFIFFVFGFTCLKSVLCQVFIHCSTSVCTPTPADSCVWSCNRKSECNFYLMVCGILKPFSEFLLSCRERCWETSRGCPYSCLQWRNYP